MNGNQDERFAAERAAQWISGMKTAGPKERAAFVRWMKESPKHVRDALLAAALEVELRRVDPDRKFNIEQLAASSNVIQLSGEHSSRQHETAPRRRWVVLAGAAASVAIALAIGWFGLQQSWLSPNRYATEIGEQRTIELRDGSVVSLNTQSRIRVAYSDEGRDVYLEAGQAFFDVERDARRPFRVHAGEAVVRAIGTKFDVRRRADSTSVAVIEGVVEVHASAPRPEESISEAFVEMVEGAVLKAGQGVVISETRITAPAPLDVSEVTAWQHRRVMFRDQALAKIIDEFALYNATPRIHLEGEALRSRRLSGVFNADDLESFVAYLESEYNVALEQNGSVLTIRERSSDPAPAP